ncbi:unnamed protein product [Strongylus vulgaris]|uniref:ZP domain-containing protein n=1 Tax=Strongylus vulgaris TaxID=40348 RepID=A0A3P7LL38_STRVU|nr:unnamed protein product [Strongylus vulgaris]
MACILAPARCVLRSEHRRKPVAFRGATGTRPCFCAADAIYIKLRTNRTFEGHVHVKFASNKYCYQTLVTNNQIEVLVPHEECAVPRRRSKSPEGVFLETSLAVAFHPDFTTADDRIFHFRCFHQRTSKGQQETGSPTEPPKGTL